MQLACVRSMSYHSFCSYKINNFFVVLADKNVLTKSIKFIIPVSVPDEIIILQFHLADAAFLLRNS